MKDTMKVVLIILKSSESIKIPSGKEWIISIISSSPEYISEISVDGVLMSISRADKHRVGYFRLSNEETIGYSSDTIVLSGWEKDKE